MYISPLNITNIFVRNKIVHFFLHLFASIFQCFYFSQVLGFGKGRDSPPQDEQARKLEDSLQSPEFPNEDPDLRMGMAPLCPPMPDLTGLSNEEIQILNDVFRRQQQFDVETKERIK